MAGLKKSHFSFSSSPHWFHWKNCQNSFPVYLITFLIVLCSIASTFAQDNFYFSITPESTDIVEGQDWILRCDVSKKRYIQFYWTLDGERLDNSSRRFQLGSNLHIQRVNHTLDTGIFHCIATNVSSGYSLKSSEAVLNILWITPTAEVQLRAPARSDLAIGSEMRLTCFISGNPKPTYSWFKNDVPLTSTAHMEVSENLLNVRRLQSADSGVYSCQASNEAGFVTSDKNFLLNLEDGSPSSVTLDTSSFEKHVIVKEKSTAYLNCVYRNVLRTEWYFRSSRLMPSSRITIHSNGTLQINNVLEGNEGAYVCRGVGAKNSQEFSTQLSIARLGNFTAANFQPRQTPKSPFVIAQGKTNKIKCIPPKGKPEPVVHWEDPSGITIQSSGRIYADGNYLHVTNANLRDSGQYACVVTNLAGRKRGDVSLVVSRQPMITKHPDPVRVMEGAPATLSCAFSGTPYPVTQVSWNRDGKPITPRRRYTIKPDQGVLHISKTEPIDRGIYECVVNTTAQRVKVSHPAIVQIRRKLKFTAKPVSFKLLELNKVDRLVCQAEGPEDEPQPIIYWMPTNGSSLPANVADKQGSLEFNPVLPTDKGNYTCTATSVSQGTITTTVGVDVVVRPKFKVKPRNTTAYEGFPTILHCLAVGDPQPKIKWDKNSDYNQLRDSRFTLHKNGSLSVSQVYLEDKGMYGCTAGNSGGLTRVEIYLDVQSTDEYLTEKRRKEEEDQSMIKTVIIAVCSALAYLALVIGLTVYFSLRRIRSRRSKAINATEMSDKGHDLQEQEENLINEKGGIAPSVINEPRGPFSRADLETVGMLGKGTFGDVSLARAKNLVRNGEEVQVLVKSLASNDNHSKMEFKRQMDMFRKAEHKHVVRLLAVCTDKEPHLMVLEYCAWGDLKQFLLAVKHRHALIPPLSPWQKVLLCKQVSSGMEKLASLGLVHKDLATRNILLCPSMDVKIAHLGLCRDVYKREYFDLQGRLLPVRWMAPESLRQPDRFTPKSDIWSFGVLCWEVMTLAQIPYEQASDEDVVTDVQAGHLRPNFLEQCPKQLQDAMDTCFTLSPEERNTFAAMTKILSEYVENEVDV